MSHSTDVYEGRIVIGQDKPEFIQIRYIKDAQFVVSTSIMMIVDLYRKYIEVNVPDLKYKYNLWFKKNEPFYKRITDSKPIITIDK